MSIDTTPSAPPGRFLAIPATDGLLLHGRLYEPPAGAFGTALVLPGIAVPQRVLAGLCQWLSLRGLRAVSIDYRGMWGSGGDAGVRSATLTRWAHRDAVGALSYLRSRFGDDVVALGHSFGGQLLGMHDDFGQLRGAVMIGSGVGQLRLFRGRVRWTATAQFYGVLPLAARVFDVVPPWLGPGERLPAGVAREWSRWGRSPAWFFSAVPSTRESYRRFAVPTLALRATDDPIGTHRATQALLAEMPSAPRRYVQLTPAEVGVTKVGHMGLLRRSASASAWPLCLAHLRDCLGTNREAAA
ncbi:MAG: alpha/beta fold hydrolase [Myxococcales bacterium]